MGNVSFEGVANFWKPNPFLCGTLGYCSRPQTVCRKGTHFHGACLWVTFRTVVFPRILIQAWKDVKSKKYKYVSAPSYAYHAVHILIFCVRLKTMPHEWKRTSTCGQFSAEDLNTAIDKVHEGDISKRQAARTFSIGRTTLDRYLNKNPERETSKVSKSYVHIKYSVMKRRSL